MRTRSFNLVRGSFLFMGLLAVGCSDATPQESGDTGGSDDSAGGSAGTKVASAGASSTAGKSGGGGKAEGGSANTGGTKAAGGSSPGAGGSVGKGGAKATGGSSGTVAAGGANAGGTKGTGGSGSPPDGGASKGGHTGPDASGAGGSGTTDASTSKEGGTTGGGKSAGCGKTPTLTSSQYNNGSTISITAASKQRRYILNVPTNYDNNKPYKLVLAIHELNGNDKEMYSQKYYGLLPLSNDTAIFAAPNGTNGSSPCSGTGSGDSGCGWPNSSGQDMALMDAVVAQLEENFCIDTDHIFATGWSYGASMSYEVGCERPLGGTGTATWGVRAIAIYAVRQMSGSCKPSTPIGYYATHGTHDSVLDYSGGVTCAQNFAKANGCTWATPTSVSSGAHACTNEAGCKAGYPLEFCSFNGDHTPYPDNGQQSGSWGPAEAWKFLSQF